mmetsp:Transcript_57309/g.149306  ORF Transcript_57309/g.149306 Transcript_57309/m.149306 type:complete len:242 (-) Transcript_57309:710-1435(-)
MARTACWKWPSRGVIPLPTIRSNHCTAAPESPASAKAPSNVMYEKAFSSTPASRIFLIQATANRARGAVPSPPAKLRSTSCQSLIDGSPLSLILLNCCIAASKEDRSPAAEESPGRFDSRRLVFRARCSREVLRLAPLRRPPPPLPLAPGAGGAGASAAAARPPPSPLSNSSSVTVPWASKCSKTFGYLSASRCKGSSLPSSWKMPMTYSTVFSFTDMGGLSSLIIFCRNCSASFTRPSAA